MIGDSTVRLRYLFGLILAILLSPFLAFWAWSSIEAARLDHAFDALEARGEPLDPAALQPTPTTDEQRQASHYYKQASSLVADLVPRWLTESGRIIEDYCTTSDPVTRRGREASLKSLEDRYRQALDLLDRATALDANGWDARDRPPHNSIEENLPYELAGVNAVRIARLACGGNGEAAASALLATLRLQRILFPVYAARVQTTYGLQSVLRSRAIPPKTLEALQREYERLDDEHAIQKTLLYQRAEWLSLAAPGAFSDPPPGYTTWRMTPFEAIARRLSRPARDHATVRELREFDQVLSAAAVAWPRKLDEAERVGQEYPRPNSRGSAIASLINPLSAHVASNQLQFIMPQVAESLAKTRASIVALGIARWRADHPGALPSSLQDLPRAYLSRPLADPYTGGELRYRADDGQFKVYSVGKNRQDDGGVWDQRSDLQFSRRGDPLDVGIVVRPSP